MHCHQCAEHWHPKQKQAMFTGVRLNLLMRCFALKLAPTKDECVFSEGRLSAHLPLCHAVWLVQGHASTNDPSVCNFFF